MGAFSHITFAAKSDIGRKRKNNEDAFGAFPSFGMYCVADGMGGGDDGEVASAATVGAVERFVKSHPLPNDAAFPAESVIAGIRHAVNQASKWIYERAKDRNLKGCGSTFVGVFLDPSSPREATALHSGDSRLYRIRGKSIRQITKDHSAAELIGAKNESDINPMFRGMILRAVGIQPSVEVEATPFPVKEGDSILICSDGLSRMVPDKKIASIVRESGTPDAAVGALVAAANEAGGIDNITVVLVNVGNIPTPLPTVDMPHAGDGSESPTVAGNPGDMCETSGDATSPSFDVATGESDDDAASFATETSTNATLTGSAGGETVNTQTPTSLVGTGWKVMQDAVAGESSGNAVARRKVVVVAAVAVAAVVLLLIVVAVRKSGASPAQGSEPPAAEEGKVAEMAAKMAEMQRQLDDANERAESEKKHREAMEEQRKKLEEQQKEIADRQAKLAQEEAERIAKAKAEEERISKERKAREEAERIAKAKAEEERISKEKKAREEAERIEKEKNAARIAEMERQLKEAQARAEKEKADREAEAKRLEAARAKAAEEARRRDEVREKAGPNLRAAWEYCDSGEAKDALVELKAANDIGYVISAGEFARVRVVCEAKIRALDDRIKDRRVNEQDRESLLREREEIVTLLAGLKSEN